MFGLSKEKIIRFLKDEFITLVLVFLWILFLFIMTVATARGHIDWINEGQCYYEQFSVGINETYYKNLTVCAGNCTFENETIEFNIELFPGQDTTFNQGNCKGSFKCNLGEEQQARCVVDEILEPGDTFESLSEACNVRVEVEDCKDKKCETEYPTEYKEDYRIEYNGFDDRVEIEFAGKEYVYSLGNDSSFDVTNTLTFTCPTVLEEDTSPDDILTQCKNVVPVYCTDMTRILIDRFDACEGRKGALENDLKVCQDTVAQSVCVESKFYAELLADKTITKNESDRCNFQEGFLEGEVADLDDTKNGLMFINVISWGLVAILKVKLDKTKPRKKTGLI